VVLFNGQIDGSNVLPLLATFLANFGTDHETIFKVNIVDKVNFFRSFVVVESDFFECFDIGNFG